MVGEKSVSGKRSNDGSDKDVRKELPKKGRSDLSITDLRERSQTLTAQNNDWMLNLVQESNELSSMTLDQIKNTKGLAKHLAEKKQQTSVTSDKYSAVNEAHAIASAAEAALKDESFMIQDSANNRWNQLQDSSNEEYKIKVLREIKNAMASLNSQNKSDTNEDNRQISPSQDLGSTSSTMLAREDNINDSTDTIETNAETERLKRESILISKKTSIECSDSYKQYKDLYEYWARCQMNLEETYHALLDEYEQSDSEKIRDVINTMKAYCFADCYNADKGEELKLQADYVEALENDKDRFENVVEMGSAIARCIQESYIHKNIDESIDHCNKEIEAYNQKYLNDPIKKIECKEKISADAYEFYLAVREWEESETHQDLLRRADAAQNSGNSEGLKQVFAERYREPSEMEKRIIEHLLNKYEEFRDTSLSLNNQEIQDPPVDNLHQELSRTSDYTLTDNSPSQNNSPLERLKGKNYDIAAMKRNYGEIDAKESAIMLGKETYGKTMEPYKASNDDMKRYHVIFQHQSRGNEIKVQAGLMKSNRLDVYYDIILDWKNEKVTISRLFSHKDNDAVTTSTSGGLETQPLEPDKILDNLLHTVKKEATKKHNMEGFQLKEVIINPIPSTQFDKNTKHTLDLFVEKKRKKASSKEGENTYYAFLGTSLGRDIYPFLQRHFKDNKVGKITAQQDMTSSSYSLTFSSEDTSQ